MVAVLRLIHIVFGAFWAGGTMLLGWLAIPNARALGPAAAPFMQGLLKRRLSTIMLTSGLITIAAGLTLWILRPPSFATWQGYALAIGALAAIVGISIGIGFQLPTGRKVKALGDAIAAGGGPPSAEQGMEMGQLQAKMGTYGNILAYLFAIALAGMALSGV
jgi:hypothetical protein